MPPGISITEIADMAKNQTTAGAVAAELDREGDVHASPTQPVTISEADYKALVAENESLRDVLQNVGAQVRQRDETIAVLNKTIDDLKSLLDEAGQQKEIIVASPRLVIHNGKHYEADQAAYWIKGIDRPIKLGDLTEAQIEQKIKEGRFKALD